MAVSTPSPATREDVDGSIESMNHSETTKCNQSLKERYLASNPEQRVQPMDNNQLPSPSPSVSPRSTSPSPVLTDSSSAEPNGKLGEEQSPNTSKSFEAVAPQGKRENGAHPVTIHAPRRVSKVLLPQQLREIKEEQVVTSRKQSISKDGTEERILKLSPSEIEELTSQPESLPLPPIIQPETRNRGATLQSPPSFEDLEPQIQSPYTRATVFSSGSQRPNSDFRAASSPQLSHRESWHDRGARNISPVRRQTPSVQRSEGFDPNASLKSPTINSRSRLPSFSAESAPQPSSQEIPLPPLLSTYLQLELASSRPSPLYIHRSRGQEYPYESAKVKFERLLNFLLVPVYFEPAVLFGTLACLDAWLYTFTILPLRFVKAIGVLVVWWAKSLATEARFVVQFIYHGSPRLWRRRKAHSCSVEERSVRPSQNLSEGSRPQPPTPKPTQNGRLSDASANGVSAESRVAGERRLKPEWGRRHRRTKSIPSTLSSYHKADILQGMVIIFSCIILMQLDASRMYHSIRGQAAMKLYVIYNVLEVGDRLLAALGQDVLECLVSDETLGRGLDGRSRLLRPLGMFILALTYNVIHATALFYQVITLNVAVNSYSNSLFTLLLSNQFVEIKGTVFKRIEKQNLFQLFCADIVERFQLWLMLIIIGLRNIVEVGGLSIVSSSPLGSGATDAARNATIPLRNSIIPNSFAFLPSWSGEVLSPFLVVLGSEVLVDWIKHCFVGKFNNVKPAIYRRFLDVLAKDYYTNAFVDQNLTKRLGLPVIPLSCLFIRAAAQTYSMFLAANFPPPLPSTATSIAAESGAAASPATTAAMEHLDSVIRRALGRATHGAGLPVVSRQWYRPDADDAIALVASAAFFLGAFLALLAAKLVLGMLLLRYSRRRYGGMTAREKVGLDTKGKRLGGLGVVELDEEKRAVFYEDDPEGGRQLKERERKWAEQAKVGTDFEKVTRYEMAAKRIW